MRYNPDINPKAYAPDTLRARLAVLEKLEYSRAEPRSRARLVEMSRIENHLAKPAAKRA